jgi:hypothetical protein
LLVNSPFWREKQISIPTDFFDGPGTRDVKTWAVLARVYVATSVKLYGIILRIFRRQDLAEDVLRVYF